jgi:hypothetical protein
VPGRGPQVCEAGDAAEGPVNGWKNSTWQKNTRETLQNGPFIGTMGYSPRKVDQENLMVYGFVRDIRDIPMLTKIF